MWAALFEGPRRHAVAERFADALAAELPGALGAAGDLRKRLVGLSAAGMAAFAARPDLYTAPSAAYVREALGIEASVTAALEALPGAKFERVLHPVFEQDEATLIAVGCALGGAVGLAQVPLY